MEIIPFRPMKTVSEVNLEKKISTLQIIRTRQKQQLYNMVRIYLRTL